MKMNRRNFLKNAAATAGVLSIPTVVPSSVFGKTAPSNKVHLASIGVGGQGSGLLRNASYNESAVVVAVSDCFASRRQNALNSIKEIYAQQGREKEFCAKEYADFRELLAREDIDGIIIATPDHWHVPVAYRAVQAGKDVYVEKPLGTSMEDGFKLRKLIQEKSAVFQYGTQQRSDRYFQMACELTRNGYIGELKSMDVWCDSIGNHELTGKTVPTEPVPADLDYDRWLGPAPKKPYSTVRCTSAGSWHIYDYALGFIAGWGAHPLDIAQWGNDSENTAPIKYEGTGTVPTGGLFNTVSHWDLNCTYANGVKMHFMDRFTAMPVVTSYYDKADQHGTTFHGTEGWVTVRRGRIDFSDEKMRRIKLKDTDVPVYKSFDHMGNFIDCIKSRKKTTSTVEAAVQSDLISHLGNAVVRLNQSVQWDPKAEKVVGDNAREVYDVICRTEREPWAI